MTDLFNFREKKKYINNTAFYTVGETEVRHKYE